MNIIEATITDLRSAQAVINILKAKGPIREVSVSDKVHERIKNEIFALLKPFDEMLTVKRFVQICGVQVVSQAELKQRKLEEEQMLVYQKMINEREKSFRLEEIEAAQKKRKEYERLKWKWIDSKSWTGRLTK